ncbi:MAG: hypothetical protein COB36_14510 [Alphaproteobacteria bacterium]|nr:MAG: hypothetical protein COB36_14510 [Alphaproteobacteria bacterium]
MYIEVNGTHLFFDIEGSLLTPNDASMKKKPTLILLHGGPGWDHSVFRPHFNRLTDIAQIIYLDQRGHGRSKKTDPREWSLQKWADDIPVFCKKLGIEKPCILGHSFGGYVAQAYAVSYPDHASKLILMNTSPKINRQRKYNVFKRLGGSEVMEAAREYWENITPQSGMNYLKKCIPYTSQHVRDPNEISRVKLRREILFHFHNTQLQLDTFDYREQLSKITCPVLVIGGEDDPVTPIEDSKDLVAYLPTRHVRFEQISECGHASYIDQPDKVFQAIGEFIKR